MDEHAVEIAEAKEDKASRGTKISKELPSEKERNRSRLIEFVIELILFVGLSVIFVANFTGKSLANSKLGDVEAWRWCIVMYVLVAGLILGLWVMDTLFLLLGLVFRLFGCVLKSKRKDLAYKRKKAAHVVLGLRQSGACFIWIAALLAAWVLLIIRARPTDEPDEKTRKALDYITRALIGFLIGLAIWTVKTLLLEVVALCFIVCRAEKKTQETKQEQKQVHTICEHIRSSRVGESTDVVKEGRGKRVFKHEHRYIKKPRNWTPNFIIDEIIEIELPPLPSDETGEKQGEVDEDISIQTLARQVGDEIFNGMVEKYDSQSIPTSSSSQDYSKFQYIEKRADYQNDKLMTTLAEVIRTDKSLSKERSVQPGFWRSNFKKWIEKVYVNRLVLLRTLNGREEAVKNLNWIVSVNVIVIILIVWLLEMGFLTTKVLLAILTQLITINFIFGDSAKSAFQAILFVFVTQPFDVGDKIQVEKGDEMVVHEMNILGTVAKLIDGKRVFYPNSTLVGKEVINFYFVPDLSDDIEFYVEVPSRIDHLPQKRKTETTGKFEYKKNTEDQPEKKPELRARRANSEKWKPDAKLEHYLEEHDKRMRVILNVSHAMQYYDEGDRTLHRNELELKVKKYLEEFKIKLL